MKKKAERQGDNARSTVAGVSNSLRQSRQRKGRKRAPFCLFGAQTLLEHLHAMMAEKEGVRRADDIEHIHRMRVASRRLRSTVPLFQRCLPSKRLPEWRKQIRRVTRALGAARDTDVQIESVQQFLADVSDPQTRVGVERLLLRLQQRRARLQPKVEKALDRLEASAIEAKMERRLRKLIGNAQRQRVDVRSPFVYARAQSAIAARLEELLAYEPYVEQPDRVAELHAMRIAAKRLRYTIETFMPLYDDALKESRRMARSAQELLGDIHDCDVWIESLPQFLEEEAQRTQEYFGHTDPMQDIIPGVDSLRAERQQFRAQRYQEFVEFWRAARSQGVWEEMLTTLEAYRAGTPLHCPDGHDPAVKEVSP